MEEEAEDEAEDDAEDDAPDLVDPPAAAAAANANGRSDGVVKEEAEREGEVRPLLPPLWLCCLLSLSPGGFRIGCPIV